MRFDLPAIADSHGQAVAPPVARCGDQLPDVRLRAPAMVMDDVQNALQRRMRVEARLRRLAQRSQGIGGDIARNHLVVVRMTLEQTLEIASAELRLASGERPASRMHDERIVGEHVTPAGTRGTKAEVVLLAIARTERHVERSERVDCRAPHEHAEPDAGWKIGIRRHRAVGQRARDGRWIRVERPAIVLAEASETSRSPRCSRTA
jgi:hypothetical protein